MQAKPKILRKLRLCHVLAATRKRQVAPERLLQTHSTFSKSVMVCMGVSNLERMARIDLIIIDARMKINCALP